MVMKAILNMLLLPKVALQDSTVQLFLLSSHEQTEKVSVAMGPHRVCQVTGNELLLHT